jgi:hypothetical protein
MEWYVAEFMKSTPQYASVLGAIQLIMLAAVWVFELAFTKPVSKD